MENQALNKLTYENQDVNVNEPKTFDDILGYIKTTDVIPTGSPRKLIDQLVLYRSGTTYRLYINDLKNNTWFFTALS